jgi:surface antigen
MSRRTFRWIALVATAAMTMSFDLAPLPLGQGRAYADPPPWAPAHGWRAKDRYDGDEDGDRHGRKHRPEHREAVYAVPYGIDIGVCHRDLLGAAVGGAMGGLAGAQVGKGDGRAVATVGGAIIGILVGGMIGRSMDQVDQRCVGQILEYSEDQRPVRWSGPAHDSYTVTPVRTYEVQGRYCREYSTLAVVGGRSERLTGTACRGPDGTWQLVN